MAPPRQWDHDAGLALFEQGWSIPRIARYFGVADSSVRVVCDLAYRESHRESLRRTRKTSVCMDCGKTIWRGLNDGRHLGLRCRSCNGFAAATSVRLSELHCSTCGTWKSDGDFPIQRAAKARRGRHHECNQCAASRKRAARAARGISCVDCGALVTLRDPRQNPEPRCRSCANRNYWATRRESAHKAHAPRSCVVCGASLEGYHAHAVHCSGACRAEASRRRKQAAWSRETRLSWDTWGDEPLIHIDFTGTA